MRTEGKNIEQFVFLFGKIKGNLNKNPFICSMFSLVFLINAFLLRIPCFSFQNICSLIKINSFLLDKDDANEREMIDNHHDTKDNKIDSKNSDKKEISDKKLSMTLFFLISKTLSHL
jgi:flagellar biosynthesis component FlhA